VLTYFMNLSQFVHYKSDVVYFVTVSPQTRHFGTTYSQFSTEWQDIDTGRRPFVLHENIIVHALQING